MSPVRGEKNYLLCEEVKSIFICFTVVGSCKGPAGRNLLSRAGKACWNSLMCFFRFFVCGLTPIQLFLCNPYDWYSGQAERIWTVSSRQSQDRPEGFGIPSMLLGDIWQSESPLASLWSPFSAQQPAVSARPTSLPPGVTTWDRGRFGSSEESLFEVEEHGACKPWGLEIPSVSPIDTQQDVCLLPTVTLIVSSLKCSPEYLSCWAC